MPYPMWNQAKTGILVDRGEGVLAFVEKGPEFDDLKEIAQDWHEAEHSLAPAPLLTADQVREKRDQMLAASDWTQVADAPVDQAAWAIYRQDLRDIPQQDGFPQDVAWPAKP
jgi:hypothetical protein